MAGVKGKSGGPRKNSGGARPGAGRKPKEKPVEKSSNTRAKPAVVVPPEPPTNESDTLKLLQDIAFGRIAASTLQVRAAIAAVQYTHTKRGDGGKKEDVADKAKKAAGGRFGPRKPPLALVNSGR